MRRLAPLLCAALVVALPLAATGCDGAPVEDPMTGEAAREDVSAAQERGTALEVAAENADLSTSVAAIAATDLRDRLAEGGPYTLFAPADAAYDKLPRGRLAELTTAEPELLSTILSRHVVEGELVESALRKRIADAGEAGAAIETLGGERLVATIEGEHIVLTDAAGASMTVGMTDIVAANGVVHIVDTLLARE